ncbi:alcohol oxidase [Gymnopus androsaceus JB14]|uniref:Alcohol oxidase n=1 Tax=Gymnopus androsaceus JB14 TaxID=1447944 RepID=A0A6A4GMZ7_9AGAR|nr:alcohol oxidase [Gymnopus androsaceus JB14]
MLKTAQLALLALSSLVSLASGTLYESVEQLPTRNVSDYYDFIVVGGGAGGSAVANRLTEDPSTKVLLLEAGSSDFDNLDIEVPSFAPRLTGTQFDWNFTTLNQAGLNGRSIDYARGFVLGGSTAINIMAYCRGSKDDWDRWAKVTGDEGWSWESMQPYMRKIENPTPPADHRNTTGEFNPSIHGVGDYNSGDTIGIGWTQATISNGQRVNAATAYLVPVMSRSNLDIVVNTQATKILKTGSEDGKAVFRAVQFTDSVNGPLYTLNASKEVILSAGAIKTPHLLPDVGQNLQDHPLTTISWTVNSTNTLDNGRTNATFAAELLQQWNDTRTGDLTLGPGNQLGWLRLPDNATIFRNTTDPSAGPTSAHYEYIATDSFVSFSEAFPSTGNFFTMFSNLVSPSSRGNISLNSTSPFAHPLIQPNMLSTEFDIFTMREAIKAVRRFMAAQAWSGWILEETSPSSAAQTDAEIEAYIRDTCFTVNHVTCTVPMGKDGEASSGSGALNSDLTVKGTVGLRVVDASAFPFIPAAHTQVPTYILAERASDIIKGVYQRESLPESLSFAVAHSSEVK